MRNYTPVTWGTWIFRNLHERFLFILLLICVFNYLYQCKPIDIYFIWCVITQYFKKIIKYLFCCSNCFNFDYWNLLPLVPVSLQPMASVVFYCVRSFVLIFKTNPSLSGTMHKMLQDHFVYLCSSLVITHFSRKPWFFSIVELCFKCETHKQAIAK